MPMMEIFAVVAEEAAAEAAAQAAAEALAEQAAQAAAQQAAQAAAQQTVQQGITQAAAPGVEQLGSQGITSLPIGEPLPPATDGGGAPLSNGGGDEFTEVNQVGRGIGNKATQLGYGNAPQFNANEILNPAQANWDNAAQELRLPNVGGNLTTLPDAEPSALKTGWDSITKFMKDNPMTSAIGTYGILNASGALKPQNTSFNAEPYKGPLNNYRLAPNFQTYPQGPNTNIYQPSYTRYAADGGIMQASGGPVSQMSNNNIFNNSNYPGAQYSALNNSNDVSTHPYTGQQMAGGGIVAFAAGGNAQSYSDYMNTYSKMLENPANTNIPYSRSDVGIFNDSNPNTRKLSAADAALYQQKALNNRYGIHTPVNLPSGAMGRINTVPVTAKQTKGAADDVEAAGGGIMQAQRYNLGGYAHGGNPRLLRGPGDGMSDNIPATIAGSQPARLADGEFVVPADVVSGLGNGSTEAGAKHLHKMMDEIRMARTGTKKQGKQINPNKFIPT